MPMPYDGLIDGDLERPEFRALEDITDQLSLALLKDALCPSWTRWRRRWPPRPPWAIRTDVAEKK